MKSKRFLFIFQLATGLQANFSNLAVIELQRYSLSGSSSIQIHPLSLNARAEATTFTKSTVNSAVRFK